MQECQGIQVLRRRPLGIDKVYFGTLLELVGDQVSTMDGAKPDHGNRVCNYGLPFGFGPLL